MLTSPTVIPAHTRVEGSIETPSDLTVEGFCQGVLHVGGTLTVTTEATCRANIRARIGAIYGEVIGNIVCTESITLGEGARVVGDVRAPEISIDPSSEVDGQIDFLEPKPDEYERSTGSITPVTLTGGGLRRPSPPTHAASTPHTADGD